MIQPFFKFSSSYFLLSFSVTNKDELMVLDGLISSGEVTVRWSHVRGHSGLEGNEAADELARAGARRDTRA